MRSRSHLNAAIFCAACVASATASAQQPPDAANAQQRYERAIAYCNNSNLPRPERDACVRDAGRAFDRARGGGPAPNSPPPQTNDNTITSPDGRSTIVLPAGGSKPVQQ